MNSEYTTFGGMTAVAAVNERAKLSIPPVFLNVFIAPEPTPYFAGGVEDIIAEVLAGQKNASPIPEIVSMIPISSRVELTVSWLNNSKDTAAMMTPAPEIYLKPNLSVRIPPTGPTTAEARANGMIRYAD